MGFKQLDFQEFTGEDMQSRSETFLNEMSKRRSIRTFSDRSVPIKIIYNCIQTAASAPSGANKQPWQFVVVKDPAVKAKIRQAAELEEKEFYRHRATKEWLEDLNQFGTDWHKPFLDIAPYLIVVFKQAYDIKDDGSQRKNYYVNESVGIASGFLLAALYQPIFTSSVFNVQDMALVITGFALLKVLKPSIVMLVIGFILAGVVLTLV